MKRLHSPTFQLPPIRAFLAKVYVKHMPYGRRKYKQTRVRKFTKAKATAPRRRYSRRKAYRKVGVIRPKWTPAVSQKQAIKFVYADASFSRTLNVAGNYCAYYVFRGNSPYDPDYTGVGVQPYAWDDFVADGKYSNFICPASKIGIYFRPEETYASIRRLHARVIACRGYAPVMTDISDVRMMPLQKATCYDGGTESTKGARLSHYCTTRKVCNLQPNDAGCEGSYNGNVSGAAAWYWLVHFYTDVYDDEEVDIYFDVKISYYTLLSRNAPPNES